MVCCRKSGGSGVVNAETAVRERGTSMNLLRSRTRLAAVALVAAALATTAALIVVPRALAATMSTCPKNTLVVPFQKWGDSGSYFLAPGGAFEGTLTGWTATGSAKIVSGNETSYVNSTKDKYSVSLPNGSAIVSPSVCVTTSTPNLRLFVRNTGSAAAKLNVNMTFTDSAGHPSTVTVASVSATSSWSLSPVVNFLQNVAPLVNGSSQTWVTFTFTPVGTGGAWQVDDFYVDPMKGH